MSQAETHIDDSNPKQPNLQFPCFKLYFKCLALGTCSLKTSDIICKAIIYFWGSILCLCAWLFIVLSILIIVSITKYGSFAKSTDCDIISNRNGSVVLTHRGYIDEYPANTLPSIIKSYEMGFGAEIDVFFTKDDRAVLAHDNNLFEFTGIDDEITNLDYSEIEQLQINQKIRGVSYTNYSTIPLLSDVLNTICGDASRYIARAPYIQIDTKFGSLSPLMNGKDKYFVGLFLNIVSNSSCAALDLDIVYFLSSWNVQTLVYLKEEWPKYDIKGSLLTLFWLFPQYPLGQYFWLKTRLEFLFISNTLDVIGAGDEAMDAHKDLFNKYKQDGYCIATWMDVTSGFNGLEELNYDKYLDTADLIVANMKEEKWLEMASNATSDMSVYNEAADRAVYGCIVTMVVLSWVGVFACCFLLRYVMQKQYKLCCCVEDDEERVNSEDDVL
eukprot:85769_1